MCEDECDANGNISSVWTLTVNCSPVLAFTSRESLSEYVRANETTKLARWREDEGGTFVSRLSTSVYDECETFDIGDFL